MRFPCVILEFTDMAKQLGRMLVAIISPLKLQYQNKMSYEISIDLDLF